MTSGLAPNAADRRHDARISGRTARVMGSLTLPVSKSSVRARCTILASTIMAKPPSRPHREPPRAAGKTVLQIGAITLYLLPLPEELEPLRVSLMALAVAVTVVTGVDYVFRALRLRRAAPNVAS